MALTYSYSFASLGVAVPLSLSFGDGVEGAPSVAALAGGGWIAVWAAFDNNSLHGAIYDDRTLRTTFAQPLNTTSTGDQGDPDVTVLTTGNAVAVWTDESGGTGNFIVRGRILAPTGATVGSEFVLSGGLSGDQINADVAALGGGRFVAVWSDADSASDVNVRARIFNADGTPVAGDIAVFDGAVLTSDPHVAALTGGGFVAVWSQTAGANTEIWFRRFDDAGVALSAAVRADSGSTLKTQPQVIARPDGGFAITYTDNGYSTGSSEITLIRYSALGVFQNLVIANQGASTSNQTAGALTALSNDMIVVGWQTNETFSIDRALLDAGGSFLFNSSGTAASNSDRVALAGVENGTFAFASVALGANRADASDDEASALVQRATRTVTGNSENDYYSGDSLFENISGNGGSDLLSGGGGDDNIFGGAGSDFIDGGAGADDMDGGADFDAVSWLTETNGVVVNLNNQAQNAGAATGDEVSTFEAYYLTNAGDQFTNNATGGFIYGFGGNDTIAGGVGSDFIDGGIGGDAINAGGGFDYVSYSNATSGVGLNLANTAANTGEAGGDVVTNAEAFYLSTFDDTFIGQVGQNIVFGLGGNDVMTGGAGANDWLFGGDGNDTLIGGALDDLLSGEGGNDIYHYNTWVGEGFDSIFTFQSGADRLRFTASNFGFAAGASLNATNFKTGTAPAATATAPTFLYNLTNGILSFDLDGTGASFGIVNLAQLAGAPALSAGDLLFS